jgi:hypothetical protein
MKKVQPVLFAMLLTAAPVWAQTQPQQPQSQKAPGEQPAPAKEERSGPPREGFPVNVRIEVTITDQRGDVAPIVKTVTKTVADRWPARIRTSGDVMTKLGPRQVVLNVDTFPRIVPAVNGTPTNKLRVDMTLEYRPKAADADTEQSATPPINETLTVFLEDGKSMVISQSADPATDRKVKVEVKATILR